MPKVSVIIPTYNCSKWICAAIESVLMQTYRDLEIIVVDDGSTDDTKKVLKPYIDREVINYIYQENKGLPGARNTGIKNAKGEFIAVLDADDEFMPNALKRCFDELVKECADWCITDILRKEGNREEIRKSDVPADNYFQHIMKKDFIRQAFFLKKEAIFDVGLYDETMINREDWDLKIRLIENKKKFVYIPEPLYKYKIRKKSITKNNDKEILFYTMRLLQKHHKKLSLGGDREMAKIYSDNVWDLAKDHFFQTKDWLQVFKCVMESLRFGSKPKRVKAVVDYILRKNA